MENRHINHAFIPFILLLLALLARYPVSAADLPITWDSLAVDFTNEESRSISVRLGSADGITTEMNFAVIDSTGKQITEFFPYEILTDRFWSGPIARDSFTRIRTGAPVIRIDIDQAEAAKLRRRFAERIALLEEERRLKRFKALREERAELEDDINELEVELYHLGSDLRSLQEKLTSERAAVQRKTGGLQDRIDDLRDDRSDLVQDRKDLQDRKNGLLKRSEPPRDLIEELNEKIRDLDREIEYVNIEISDLRQKIRDYQERVRDNREEVSRIREKRRLLDDERDLLERELDSILGEMETLNREVYP